MVEKYPQPTLTGQVNMKHSRLKATRLTIWLIITRPFPLISLIFLLPVIAGAEPGTDRLFTAEIAGHHNTLTGFTRARATMTITSQLTDQLVEVKADIGDKIGPDGIFARLDPTYAELDLDKIRIEKAKMAKKIAYLKKEVNRFQTLFEKQSAAEAKLDSLIQDLDQAELSGRSLENEERRLREHLSRHNITAPPAWLVISRNAEPGEWVAAGAPLAEVGDFRTLLVPFAVGRDEYTWLKRREDDLNLYLPEYKLTVKAGIHSVSPGFDLQTRKMNLQLAIVSEMPEKRGGIRAELTTELPDPAGAIQVPTTAVSNRYDSSWLTRDDGEKAPVIVLGNGARPGTLRVTGEAVRAGDIFRRSPDSQASSQE